MTPGDTFGKLLVVLDHLASEAARLGDNAVCERTELALLHAIELGEQLGLLSDIEAAERREEAWAALGTGGQDQRSVADRP